MGRASPSGAVAVGALLTLALGMGAACGTEVASDPVLQLSVSNGLPVVSWEMSPLFLENLGQVSPLRPYYRLDVSKDLLAWKLLGGVNGAQFGASRQTLVATRADAMEAPAFFRVTRRIDGAFANLGGTDLRRTALAGADLYSADLRGADLTGADLHEADLRAANLHGAILAGARLDGALMPAAEDAVESPDAELLVLRLTDRPGPSPELYGRIRADLEQIQAKFPILADVHPRARWQVGVLLFNGTEDSFKEFSALWPEPRPIALVDHRLRFAHRYNPEVLAQLMAAAGLGGVVSPNHYFGDGDDVEFEPVAGRYTFWRKWGDCPGGCAHRHAWVIEMQSGIPFLVEESGDPLP